MATSLKKPAHFISDKGLQIIKEFEGLVLHPYLDVVKVPTIGYGTTQYENGKAVTMKDSAITKERAQQLLQFESQAKAYVLNQTLAYKKVQLNQNQFDSLCSFSYNTGINALLKSTLLRKVVANPLDTSIAYEFSRWNKGHKNGKLIVIDALTRRRKEEAELYFS